MADNPLVVGKKAKEFRSKYTALEWARMARDKGLLKHESAWLAEARRRGEIPDHSEPKQLH